ncbi:MAG TPA: hypothetical protein VJ326_04740 [Thermoplasmata archaeon]|nr:hypothetical protein [Thermoplasmata archaeon]
MQPDACVMTKSGECRGPVVADLVIQVKRGRSNVGTPQKLPLCVVHALKGRAYSWIAHAGESIVWNVIQSVAPTARKGLRVSHRVVVRPKWRNILLRLGVSGRIPRAR